MKTTITATSAAEVLEEVRRHYERESGRLERLAGLTTGRERKDRQAQAAYASQQARFWASVEIEA